MLWFTRTLSSTPLNTLCQTHAYSLHIPERYEIPPCSSRPAQRRHDQTYTRIQYLLLRLLNPVHRPDIYLFFAKEGLRVRLNNIVIDTMEADEEAVDNYSGC